MELSQVCVFFFQTCLSKNPSHILSVQCALRILFLLFFFFFLMGKSHLKVMLILRRNVGGGNLLLIGWALRNCHVLIIIHVSRDFWLSLSLEKKKPSKPLSRYSMYYLVFETYIKNIHFIITKLLHCC